jgi:collagenase-like PrtC family protease
MRITAPISRAGEIGPMLAAGADELYFGVVPLGWAERFGVSTVNRRTFGNLEDGEALRRAVGDIRDGGGEASLALNGQQYTAERLELLQGLAERFAAAGGNAVIVGDMVLLDALARMGLDLRLHISSIAACRNSEAALFYQDFGAARVVFPRHMTLAEMADVAAAAPELEFEAFVLNDGCLFDEGVCHTIHLPMKLGGPICMDSYDLDYRRQDGRPPTAREQAALDANDAAYERWAWHKFSCGFSTTDDGQPFGPCGLCAIPYLAANGIGTIKIAGRETPTERKLKSLELVRATLDRMEQAADPAALSDFARNLRARPDRCAEGYMCYYPEVLDEAEPAGGSLG